MKVHFSIPFFGGDSKAAYSDKHRRSGYLCQTVNQIKLLKYENPNIENIYIHVCNKNDADLVFFLYKESVIIIYHDIDPIYLATSSLCNMQKASISSEDYIFHTEADQIINSNFEKHLHNLSDNNYLSPHRLEEVPYVKSKIDQSLETQIFDGKKYIVANRTPNCDNNVLNNYYICRDRGTGFGGAFLSKFSSFRKVEFKFSEFLPVEHASGFNMFAYNQCLKTLDVLDFFVIHLSGYDFNLSRNSKVSEVQ